MLARLSMLFLWARARFASVVFGTIGIYAAWLTMWQSYHFGHGLGVTDVGKESYAQWLTLADVATAILPIAAVVMWRRGSKKTSFVLGITTAMFVAFTITNQMGFGASERLGKSAHISAINKAAADAKAEQQALIKGQIKWNNNSTTSRATTRSSRKENIASTERLIAAAGTIDPTKVYSAPADIQATALVSLVHRWTDWKVDVEGMALFLVAAIAILGTLMKPIFLGLMAHFYPETKRELQTSKAKRDDKDDRDDDDAGAHPGTSAFVEPPATEIGQGRGATVHTEALVAEPAPEPVITAVAESTPTSYVIENAQEARPALMAAVAASEAAEAQAKVEAEEPRTESEPPSVSVPSIREYLVTPKSESARLVRFKEKDTREHARLTDGHMEVFVETLIGYVPNGESIPFKSSVWEKYKQFCAEENLRPMHEKALSNALARFGIIRHRPTGGSVYLKLPADLSEKIALSRKFFAKDNDAGLATAH